MRHHRQPSFLRRQRGAVLFVALILLLILTLLGVTAARMETAEERMAMNDDNHQLALQSGEAVLRQVEDQIAAGMLSNDESFVNGVSGQFDLAKELGATGVPTAPPGNGTSIADQTTSMTTSGVAYGGPSLGNVPVPTPTYIVEQFPAVSAAGGDPMCNGQYPSNSACIVNRITVLAQGGDTSSHVTVESIFH
jgi:type IV pilus assembly protein PilX